MTGVPLSPEPLVRSHREPIKSVSFLGVVPCDTISPTRLSFFSRMRLEIASLSASPDRSLKSLSARYFSFSSLGVPSRPGVLAGDTQGSASSQILPTGSLKAPSPYTITSTCLPVLSRISFWISSTRSVHSLGNSLIVSSVDLLEPSRPYFSLQPLPFTGLVRISSIPMTRSAPAASSSLFVRALVWISQFNTFFV